MLSRFASPEPAIEEQRMVHPAAVVLVLVLIPFCIDLVSSLLNRSWLTKPIPQELSGIYDEESYSVSQKYNKEKSTVNLIETFVEMAFFLGFWFAGGFRAVDNLVIPVGLSTLFTGVLYIAVLGLAGQVLSLPFSIYRTFSLEARYGFNRTTPWTYIKDLLKGLLLIIVLGMPMLTLLLAIFLHAGQRAWLYTWLCFVTIQVVMFFLAPVLILPLFLEMIPLPSGLAIAVDGINKESPWLFLKRIFYEIEEGYRGQKAYETRDRQYAGAEKGGKLTLWCDEGTWKMSEGSTQEALGVCYASSTLPAQSPEVAPWQLHRNQGEGEAGADRMQEPLAQAGQGVELKLVRHDLGALRRDLLALADRLEYKCDKLFIIDGSTRSEHSNAFCTGFGTFRRICLFDTLLCQLSPDEIVAVLGHEIGHDKLHHVKIGLLQGMVLLFVELFMLGQFISNTTLAHAFFLPEAKVYTGFILFSIVWATVEAFLSIPMTVQSRRHEYQADMFSIEADARYGAWLASGLRKMTRNSKDNLTPHPMKVFLDYSHPPLLARVKHIEEYAEKKWGKTA